MPKMKALLTSFVAAVTLFTLPAGGAARSERAGKLEEAAASKQIVRTVYFVEGMSCRACTLLLDRHLAKEKGVLWARFNYPLRLFTAYHDPDVMSVTKLEEFVDQHEELDVVLMESRPAASFPKGDAVAVWRGGSYALSDALALPPKFQQGLSDYMLDEGTPEWYQVVYEIAGEDVRNLILQGLARKNGFDGAEAAELPFVVSKDFYWPSGNLEPTADEKAMARYVSKEILGGEEGHKESIKKFDAWLKVLYEELDFEFRGEIMELQEAQK